MPAQTSAASGRIDDGAFVGRDAELRTMRSAAQGALAGRPASILVDGPPGIGKSALLREFARRTPEFTTIAVTAYPDECALPYGLITQLALTLKARGHDPGLSVATRAGDPVTVGMALLESLSAAAADSPVLVLVDDLQFADPESAMLLRFLVRRLWADRVCVAVALDGSAGWVPGGLPGSTASVTLSLAGLDRDDLAALVQRRWGRTDDDLIARLAGWTAGNPALVWAALSDAGWIDDPSEELPAAIDAALGSVVDRLPAGCRAVLQALSILPIPAPMAELAAVADVPGGLPELLEPLLSARLVRLPAGSPGSVEFVTATLRTATERNLDPGTRRRLHAAAAARARGREEQLAHLVQATTGADPDLARTLAAEVDVEIAAGNPVRAARYATWAADVAPDGPDRTQLLVTAVRLFVRVGRDRSALRLAERVDALPPTWLRDEAQGLLAYARGEPATALSLLRRAESTPTDLEPRARARLAAEVATVAVALFAGDLAVEASDRAHRPDEPEVDRLAAATGAFGRAIVEGPDAALAELDYLPAEPAECAEQDLTGLTFRGLFRGLVGRFDEAIADLTVAARRREATRVAAFGVTAHIHLAWCQLDVGLGEVALRTLEVGTELADVYGRAFDHAALRSSTAIILAVRGDPTGADAALAESVRLSAHADFLGPAFHQVLARAAIAWSAGRHGEVIAQLEPWTAPGVDRHRMDLFGLWWLPLLADAQVTTGRRREAARTVERLAGIDGAPGSMRDTAVAWLRGRLARHAGDVTTSLRILRAAVARPDFATRQNLYSGMVVRALGDAQHEAGDQAAARQSFQTAIGTLDAMGVAPLAARCRERMARLFTASDPPRRPAVLDRLTEKEGQVATLIARGWTNPEIAKALFVSTKTVEYHLRNIYIKLDLQSRRQLRDLLQARAA